MILKADLLNKPSLMYDCDNTLEILKEERETVAHLRDTVAILQNKINVLEKTLHTNPGF